MRMRNVYGFGRWALVVLLLAGCATPPPTPTATTVAGLASTPTAEVTATKTAVPATPTVTATPTPSPVPTATPLPLPTIPISPDNASQLTRYARWGNGRPVVGVWQPDGKAFALASTVGIELRDAHTQEVLGSWEGDYTAIAFSDDSRLMAKAELSGRIEVIDLISGASLRVVQDVADIPITIAVSHQGTVLAVAYRNSEVSLWDLGTGELVGTLAKSRAGEVRWARLLFSADDLSISFFDCTYAFAADGLPYFREWDVSHPQQVKSASTIQSDSYIYASSNGAWHLRYRAGRTAFFFDPVTSVDLREIDLPDSNPYGFAISSDGELIAQGSYDQLREKTTVTILEVETGERRAKFVINDRPERFEFSPDGRSLLILSRTVVGLGDVVSGEMLWTQPYTYLTLSVSVSQNLDRLVLISGLKTFNELAFPSLTPIREAALPRAGSNGIMSTGYSPDGRYLGPPHETENIARQAL